MKRSGTLTVLRGADGRVTVRLAGRWSVHERSADLAPVLRVLPGASGLAYDGSELGAWDSSLLGVIAELAAAAAQHGVAHDTAGLPEGARRLLALAERTPHAEPPPHRAPLGIFARIGLFAIHGGEEVREGLAFVGELAVAFVRTVLGRAHVRGRDLLAQLQRTGVEGLPIIALIGFLIGVILAFVGSLELGRFGAEAYIADLVGLGMVREVGALMTAIVVAGRTGAAFAAELATMKVTQEIDALEVIDLSPIELLVIPRVLALTAMVPLLAAYAAVLGIVGGAVIGVVVLGVPPRDYLSHTIAIVGMKDVIGGLVKAATYGLVIGIGGCAAGLRADAGAAAVGEATTRAVVTGIVFTTLVCGIYAVLFARLGV